MYKPRLFVFGDSIATNYFSTSPEVVKDTNLHLGSKEIYEYVKEHNFYGHWLDLMEKDWEVQSFARGGVSNEEIIYQLGNLPEYQDEDRVIIVLTTPERYRWFYDGNIQNFVSGTPDIDKIYQDEQQRKLLKLQFIERDATWRLGNERKNEMMFFDKLPHLLERYNPVLCSWSQPLVHKLNNWDIIDFDKDEKYTSIYKESEGTYKDWHMGVEGNKHLYEYFKNKLG